MHSALPWALLLLVPIVLEHGSKEDDSQPSGALLHAPGLHNVFQITDGLYSGSSPEGEEGFRSLRTLGIKTVISVDGARPDVEIAHKFGMRYVHVPFGYDGIPREQALRIARAIRDLPGPAYLHCHHGKHRGPAAAAIAHLCLDEKCGVDRAIAEMRRAGTDPHYTGLYAATRKFHRPSRAELDAVSAQFEEAVKVPALAESMVGVDEHWENLKRIRGAGWKTPPRYPDLDPPHEALQLVEQLREAGRLGRKHQRSEEFVRWLGEAEKSAQGLEKALRGEKEKGIAQPGEAEMTFRRMDASCTHCHVKYRDVPGKR